MWWVRLRKLLGMPKEVTLLEYLKEMDALSSMIDRVKVTIRNLRKKGRTREAKYWESKEEELVLLHMAFEWGLHPANKNPPIFSEHSTRGN